MSVELDIQNADALETVVDGFYERNSDGGVRYFDREAEGALYTAITKCVEMRLYADRDASMLTLDLERIRKLRDELPTTWREFWRDEEGVPIGRVFAPLIRSQMGDPYVDYLWEYLQAIAHRSSDKATVQHYVLRLALNRLYFHLAGIQQALLAGMVASPRSPS